MATQQATTYNFDVPDAPRDVVNFAQYHQLTHHKHQYKKLSSKKNFFLFYLLLIIIYIGVQLSLLLANKEEQDFIEEYYFLIFHALEFWAFAIFAMLEAVILIMTNNVQNAFAFGLVLFNVVFGFVVAMFFQIYPEHFEVWCHYGEFSVQILVTLVNFIFIFSSSNPDDELVVVDGENGKGSINDPLLGQNAIANPYDAAVPQKDTQSLASRAYDIWNAPENDEVQATLFKYRKIELTVATLVFLGSVFQFFVYAGIVDMNGMDPERAAHFFEYVIETVNGLFAAFFCTLTYLSYSRAALRHDQQISGRYLGIKSYV